MSGFESTQQIKEFYPNLLSVAQTVYSTKKDKEKTTVVGYDDFISKPIRNETMIEILQKYSEESIKS